MRNGIKIDDDLITFIGNGSTPEKLPDEDIPSIQKVLFIKNENVKPLSLNLENKYYVFRSDYESSYKNLHVMKNDVLFSMTGTLGNACLIKEDIEATINQNIVILRFDKDKIVPEYVVRFLNSKFIELQTRRNFTSGQIPYLNGEKIKNLRIVVLPKLVQDDIVEQTKNIELQATGFESKVQEILNEANKIIVEELKIDLAEKDIEYFLGKTSEKSTYYYRFPSEIENRIDFVYYNPIFDKIKQYRNLFEPFGNLQPVYDYGVTASGQETGIIEFLNTQNITTRGEIGDEGISFIDNCPAHLRLQENDILISRSRLVGRAAKIKNKFIGATFGSYIIRFRISLDTSHDVDFIVHYINSPLGQAQVMLLKTGASGENINAEQLMDIRLPKIDKKRQIEIVIKLKEKFKQAKDYEQKSIYKWQEAKELFENLILNEFKER